MLVSGIDSLELHTRAPVSLFWQERLGEALRWAQDGGGPVALEVGGIAFKLQPRGIPRAPYRAISDAMTLIVAPSAPKTFPSITVELRSAYLWQHGPDGAVESARALMAMLAGYAGRIEPQVSRVDLTVDFQGWPLGPGDDAGFVCRAHERDVHHRGKELTGWSFGRGDIAARLYNKTSEIRDRSPEKVWFRDVWARSPDFDPAEQVWRLEYQLRRRALRSFRAGAGHRVESWGDVRDTAPALWRFLSGRWLRRPGKRTMHARNALDPRWRALHEVGFSGPEWTGGFTGDLTRPGRSEIMKREDLQLGGHLRGAVARHLLTSPGATLEEAIPAVVARVQALEEERGRDLLEGARERAERHIEAAAAVLARARASPGADGPTGRDRWVADNVPAFEVIDATAPQRPLPRFVP